MSRFVDVTWRVIDFETTGLDEAVPVEVAYKDLPDGRQFQTLVEPGRNIEPQAMAVHHITPAMLKGAPPWAEVQAGLMKGYNHQVVFVAHNAPFDSQFLPDTGRWLCTYRMARHLWPEAPGYGNQVLRYWLGLDVNPEGHAHRAEYDVEVTAALLVRLLSNVRRAETVDELIAMVDRPINLTKRRVGFGKHADLLWSDVPRDYLQWISRQPTADWDPDVVYTVGKLLGGE